MARTVTVTLDLGNEAMATSSDVAQMLTYVAGMVTEGRLDVTADDSLRLRDRNGNAVGFARVGGR